MLIPEEAAVQAQEPGAQDLRQEEEMLLGYK